VLYGGRSDPFSIAYIDELEACLEFVRESPELSVDEKKRFFKSANMNLGASQLICLNFFVLRSSQGFLPSVYLVVQRLDIVSLSVVSFLKWLTVQTTLVS